MKKLVLPVLILLGSLSQAHPAFADAAPPQPPPGANLLGDPLTMVQMMREDVLMTLDDNTRVHVQATFEFKNQGTLTETMQVRFPAGFDMYDYNNNGQPGMVPIENFLAFVDGKDADVTFTVDGDLGSRERWANWPVSFPPSQTVKVAVTYDIQRGSTCSPEYGEYTYILATGAGWYGSIGEVYITFRTPNELNESNISAEPPGFDTSGTDLIWHLTNFEPDVFSWIRVYAMSPSAWRAIEDGRRAAAEHPDSLDAQLYAARTLWDSQGDNRGPCPSEQLADEALTYYERAISLAPNSPVIYEDYCDILLSFSYFNHPGSVPYRKKLEAALERGLELDPNNAKLIEIKSTYEDILAYEVSIGVGATRVPTRTPQPTQISEVTAEVTPTIQPAPPTEVAITTEPTASPTSASKSGSPCPGAAGVLIFPLGAVMWIARRRKYSE